MDTNTETPSYLQLAGIPLIDLSANLKTALAAGQRATAISADVLFLRCHVV